MDDRRLVRRLQEGDRDAFADLLDAYGGRVHRLVRQYVPNPTDAEDVTQDVFIAVHRSIGTFRGESSLSTWVYRVAMNHCLKYRERHRPAGPSYDDALHAQEDPAADPAAWAARGELRDQLHGALDLLSDQHRQVVVLHELHGLTYQECAQVLDVPVGTVKSRLSNAFRRLRESLQNYVVGEPALQPGAAPGTQR